MVSSFKEFLNIKVPKIAAPLIGIILFSLHLFLSWTFSGDYINHEYVGYYVEWYNLLSDHSIFSRELQFNFHIGVPLFLKPLFDVAELSPQLVRSLAIGFMAFSSSILFLAYKLKYGIIRGLSMILFLFTTTFWINFRYNEWPIVVFTVSALLYIFVRWYENEEEYLLYVISVFSGFAFYIKWSYAHVIAALVISLFLVDRKRIIEELNPQKVVFLLILFLVGLSPFLATTYNSDFQHISQLTQSSSNGDTIFTERFVELSETRYHHINDQFLIPVNPVLSENPFSNTNIYFILLLTGIAFSLIKGERIYTLTAILVYLMLYYTPHGVNHGQLVVLIPFVPLIIFYNLDMLPDFKYREYIVLVSVMALFLSSYSYLNPVETPESPYPVEMSDYDKYSEVQVSDTVATNFVHMRLLNEFNSNISNQYLVGMPPHRGSQGVSISELENMLASNSTITLLLVDAETCPEGYSGGVKESDPDSCGSSIEEIRRSNIPSYVDYKGSIEIRDYKYHIYQ